MSDPQLEATSRLLVEAFGAGGPTSVPYLDWLYRQNPAGPPVESNLDDAEGRTGHYAVVPKLLAAHEETWRLGLSLNTAVAKRVQGQGIFTKLANDVLAKSEGAGLAGIVGVANANSTPGFTRRLGFTVQASLPVKVGAAAPRKLRSAVAGADAIARIVSHEAKRRKAEPGLASPLYTDDILHWRLSRPGSNYLALANDDGGVVATRTKQAGLPFTVLIGLFPAKQQAPMGPLIAAACAHLGSPLYVYAGWNRDVAVTGLPLPMKLRPSPLNLIWREIGATGRPTPKDLRRFEFIDFDAY
jgi:hypothetical protein